MRGGHSGTGSNCGIFFIYLYRNSIYYHWANGATLSFKTIVIIFIKVQV